MMSEKLPLPEEIWNRTPPEAQALIYSLQERVSVLEEQMKELRELLALDSKNSSKPPSSDPPGSRCSTQQLQNKRKKKRKRGGQPGHRGMTRELIPSEQADKRIPVAAENCTRCGEKLEGEDPNPHRHQVVEIPPLAAQVIEYQLHQLLCEGCGHKNPAPWPKDMPKGRFGFRLQAVVSLCSGKYKLPRRATVNLVEEFFGVSISLGSVSNIEKKASEILKAPYEEAHEYLQEQKSVNVDETGYREKKKRGWLWVMASPLVTVFLLALSRAGWVAKSLIGLDFEGIVGTDRCRSYSWLSDEQRQYCWAHLIRDFEKFKLRGGRSAEIGEQLLRNTGRMFEWWHRVRDGTLTRLVFERRMKKVSKSVEFFLYQGAHCGHSKTESTCKELLKHRQALWSFVRVEGVEPTNNVAERALRPAVIWRKRSFGTNSNRGSRFVERILTVVATLKQQGRSTIEYMVSAFAAHNDGQKAPSLLPQEDEQEPPPAE